MRARSLFASLFAIALLFAACGDDDAADTATDDTAADDDGTTDEPASDKDTATDDAQDMADDMAEDLEAQQEAQGGGGATFTVDGETWEFSSVLCAMGEEETGQEDAELVISATQDGLQFYVSIDSFGNSISLDDISDFENPSVSWSAAEVVPGEEVTIEVDGNNVTGSSDAFRDGAGGPTFDTFSGSFEATCP